MNNFYIRLLLIFSLCFQNNLCALQEKGVSLDKERHGLNATESIVSEKSNKLLSLLYDYKYLFCVLFLIDFCLNGNERISQVGKLGRCLADPTKKLYKKPLFWKDDQIKIFIAYIDKEFGFNNIFPYIEAQGANALRFSYKNIIDKKDLYRKYGKDDSRLQRLIDHQFEQFRAIFLEYIFSQKNNQYDNRIDCIKALFKLQNICENSPIIRDVFDYLCGNNRFINNTIIYNLMSNNFVRQELYDSLLQDDKKKKKFYTQCLKIPELRNLFFQELITLLGKTGNESLKEYIQQILDIGIEDRVSSHVLLNLIEKLIKNNRVTFDENALNTLRFLFENGMDPNLVLDRMLEFTLYVKVPNYSRDELIEAIVDKIKILLPLINIFLSPVLQKRINLQKKEALSKWIFEKTRYDFDSFKDCFVLSLQDLDNKKKFLSCLLHEIVQKNITILDDNYLEQINILIENGADSTDALKYLLGINNIEVINIILKYPQSFNGNVRLSDGSTLNQKIGSSYFKHDFSLFKDYFLSNIENIDGKREFLSGLLSKIVKNRICNLKLEKIKFLLENGADSTFALKYLLDSEKNNIDVINIIFQYPQSFNSNMTFSDDSTLFKKIAAMYFSSEFQDERILDWMNSLVKGGAKVNSYIVYNCDELNDIAGKKKEIDLLDKEINSNKDKLNRLKKYLEEGVANEIGVLKQDLNKLNSGGFYYVRYADNSFDSLNKKLNEVKSFIDRLDHDYRLSYVYDFYGRSYTQNVHSDFCSLCTNIKKYNSLLEKIKKLAQNHDDTVIKYNNLINQTKDLLTSLCKKQLEYALIFQEKPFYIANFCTEFIDYFLSDEFMDLIFPHNNYMWKEITKITKHEPILICLIERYRKEPSKKLDSLIYNIMSQGVDLFEPRCIEVTYDNQTKKMIYGKETYLLDYLMQWYEQDINKFDLKNPLLDWINCLIKNDAHLNLEWVKNIFFTGGAPVRLIKGSLESVPDELYKIDISEDCTFSVSQSKSVDAYIPLIYFFVKQYKRNPSPQLLQVIRNMVYKGIDLSKPCQAEIIYNNEVKEIIKGKSDCLHDVLEIEFEEVGFGNLLDFSYLFDENNKINVFKRENTVGHSLIHNLVSIFFTLSTGKQIKNFSKFFSGFTKLSMIKKFLINSFTYKNWDRLTPFHEAQQQKKKLITEYNLSSQTEEIETGIHGITSLLLMSGADPRFERRYGPNEDPKAIAQEKQEGIILLRTKHDYEPEQLMHKDRRDKLSYISSTKELGDDIAYHYRKIDELGLDVPQGEAKKALPFLKMVPL